MKASSLTTNITLKDIKSSILRAEIPQILEILLIDRTTSTPSKLNNIIWANDNYLEYDEGLYAPTAQILPELITGERSALIIPRALKERSLQRGRTKESGEVFTPIWIVKKQNDTADENYKTDDLETYINRKWLEIACGEAPYMASRYDMETGEMIPISERVGFVDRKLSRINKEIKDKAEWQRLVEQAYKASYGFEWNGDSLLLARENLLNTYQDYYKEKWDSSPTIGLLKSIAQIISYNIFQMDGLTYTVPYSMKRIKVLSSQLSLFNFEAGEKEEWTLTPGKRVRIMNWDTDRMEYFDKGIKKHE